ncbi:hypothetical protein GCM10009841_32210 [Microlunatus panaciterrae]|uniref:DUF222 domain-containing protein n=1 Tax=Microlunatus panaciterrae TaxID=400768 RepID=A0ABS2RFU2_9ACTN|nr:hypothetical protein [Microlunatus panaciterrae]MBM7797879.1 hypothetical protein [Microlunatus panaciterrae]
MFQTSPLAIYLNDHLTGATGGVELSRRLTRGAKGTAHESTLQRLSIEIAEDRDTLKRIMADLQVTADPVRELIGWAGEKVGRLKPNGHLITRSPLSTLLEVEMLRLGVEGKVCLWRSLTAIAAQRPVLDAAELVGLTDRGESQSSELETIRVELAKERLI